MRQGLRAGLCGNVPQLRRFFDAIYSEMWCESVKRKTIKITIVLFLVLMIIAPVIIYGIGNSTSYLDTRANSIRMDMIDSFHQNEESYASVAVDFLDASGGKALYYDFRRADNALPETLKEKAGVFRNSTDMEFDSIYVGGQTANLYPPMSCVFRKTLYQNKGDVYCWIDLIYSPSWETEFESETLQTMEESGIIIRLDTFWCAVILYGF